MSPSKSSHLWYFELQLWPPRFQVGILREVSYREESLCSQPDFATHRLFMEPSRLGQNLREFRSGYNKLVICMDHYSITKFFPSKENFFHFSFLPRFNKISSVILKSRSWRYVQEKTISWNCKTTLPTPQCLLTFAIFGQTYVLRIRTVCHTSKSGVVDLDSLNSFLTHMQTSLDVQ